MFRSKNKASRAKRDELIASMPVDENGDVTEAYLRARNEARSRRAKMADGRSTAKRVYPIRMPPEQAASWVMHPGRSDVEGIDTASPANVGRRGTNKGKATKPETSGPVPAKKSGAVVSGREIVAVSDLLVAMECGMMALGCGDCSIGGWNRAYAISLSRRDGRGLFGLDNGASGGLYVDAIRETFRFDEDALYKVSVEDGELLFRTGENFSTTAMFLSTFRGGHYTFEDFYGPVPAQTFEIDADNLSIILARMADEGVECCRLESTKWGIKILSEDGIFDFIIGPRTGAVGSSVYSVAKFRTLLDGLSPYVHRLGFDPGGLLVLKGEIEGYELAAVMKSVPPESSANRKRRTKPFTDRRSKR